MAKQEKTTLEQLFAPLRSRYTQEEREQLFGELVYASLLAEKEREVRAALEKNPDDEKLKQHLKWVRKLRDNIPVGPL